MNDVAWAAGLVDASGKLGRSKGRYLSLTLVHPERDVLERLRSLVGCGRISGPYDSRVWKRPAWYFRAYGGSVENIMALLWPWLSTSTQARYRELRGVSAL